MALVLVFSAVLSSCDSVLEDLGLKDADEANPLVNLTVTSPSQVVEVNSTQQFAAEGTYRNGATEDLTADAVWSSEDEGVATIDETALATGADKGIVTITATVGDVFGEGFLTVFGPPDDPQPFSNVQVIAAPEVTTAGDFLTVNVPADAISMGIILRGSNTNLKMVDHGIFLRLNGGELLYSEDDSDPNLVFITAPDGSTVPLSFNQIDNCFFDATIPCGTGEQSLGDNLYNFHAASPYFPNDGTDTTLPAGDYIFPVASFNSAATALEEDTMTPFVLYKTSAPAGQTMRVNLFVVAGVGEGISTTVEAESDPEIQGAVAVLRNVYGTRVGLTLEITVEIIPDSSFAALETQEEADSLLRSNPVFSPSDAMSLFIVADLAYLGAGVIGYSAGIPGPFTLDGTVVSGTLAEYQGDGVGAILGFTLAHEFGHYLGLWHTSQTNGSQDEIIGHDPIADTLECLASDLGTPPDIDTCPDRSNLMFPVVEPETDPPLTAGQIRVIELNPAIGVP